ncbi:hypothetical protein [Salinisphaera sp. G21_0]|uniref:DUF7173 family protein n=1 Tax=Salinisphaera sp. G21_0 TaxID=2821094 RepID=UPI001ADA7537|nr:hypothetical protein [Salinisphaera sp. G21_0]MBO9484140.1 hypothetical protein [Salinisphaera sp. G21_0]
MTESNDAPRLDKLAYELELAKQAEQQAKDHRLTIEQQLCEFVGVKDEGSYSVKGDYYKVTTVSGFTRTVDVEKWQALKNQIPANIAEKVVRTKLEVDTRQLKSLRGLDPTHYNLVAEAITTKPKKVAVKYERLEVQ